MSGVDGAPLTEITAWERLAGHLDWSAGPTVSFLFSDDPVAVGRLRERAEGMVAERGAKARILHPATPLALREVVRELLTARKKVDLVWLEAVGDGRSWADAWNDVLVRLNERRERLRKSLTGSLVLVAPLALKARFRESAPDLWSIRSLVLDLPRITPEQAAHRADRRATWTNGYRIAEAVLRYQFHARMHREPWFALVVSEDPVARRRMLDALVARGAKVLVHAGPTDALTEPTDADLHWVLVEDDPSLRLVAMLAGESPARLSRPVALEGSPALEESLAKRLPDLYATVAFVVKLMPERTIHPSPLPVLDRAEVLVRSAWDALDRARTLERGPEKGETRSERVRELLRAVESLLAQGWSSEALPLLGDLALATEELRPTDPDAAWLHAESHEVAGKVAQHQGDRSEALARYRSALPIRRRLARSRGEERFRRRAQLARCLSTIGELSLGLGDVDGSEPLVREALAIRRRLAKVSDDRETLSELGMAWSLVGDLLLARHESGGGTLKAASDAYREALRLRERIASEEDTPRFRRLLSVSLGRLGKLLARSNDWEGALRAAEKAGELVAALLREDPGNVNFLSETAVTMGMVGDALRGLGRMEEAAAAYHDSSDLRRKLLAADPDNIKLQELVAIGLGRVVEISLALDQVEEADRTSLRALELCEHLVWVDPGHLKWRSHLASAQLRRGDVQRATARAEEAAESWARALAAARQLVELGSEGRRRARDVLAALEARGVQASDLDEVATQASP